MHPAYSVIGRLERRGGRRQRQHRRAQPRYHPVLEFKSDGSFVRTWGEGSRMFEGAHSVRFDRQGDLSACIDAADNIILPFRQGRGAPSARSAPIPEPWTWLTHVIERAVPGRANLYQETDIGWSRDGSMFVADGYGNSRVANLRQGRQLREGVGRTRRAAGQLNTPHSLVVDNNDVVYVADRGNSRIQTFDTDGEPQSGMDDADGALVAVPDERSDARRDVRRQSVGRRLQDGPDWEDPRRVRPARPHARHARLDPSTRVS